MGQLVNWDYIASRFLVLVIVVVVVVMVDDDNDGFILSPFSIAHRFGFVYIFI